MGLEEHSLESVGERCEECGATLTPREVELALESGGEWISSVDLENELMGHDAIAEAAVIAKPDERWTERPLACVVLEEGKEVSPEELQEHLASRVVKWWIPEDFAYIDEVPKTSVGKFDKKVLRKRLEEGDLETVSESVSASPPA